ncbi:MAG: alpha-glucan family phosphorylase [Thiohalomonadaceae bacterium]
MDGRQPMRSLPAGDVLEPFVHQPCVAYFSMEIALRSSIPTYAGGLGVLAGDTLRSAADLLVPMVGVTLLSRAGYFRQELDGQGRQSELPDYWDPDTCTKRLRAKIAIGIGGREVWIAGHLYIIEGNMGGRAPVILLDTDLEENHPDDRTLTHFLYGGDAEYRLRQECVLGIGGVRMLHALGFTINQYHMNEGHSALLVLELLKRHTYAPEDLRPGEIMYDLPRVRDLCNFTTHTPVEAGHDKFPYDLVARVLDEFRDEHTLRSLAGTESLNMTRLALNASEYVNGVAKSHVATSREMFPGYSLRSITNGVHPYTWAGTAMRLVFDREQPAWCHEPELLVNADRIADDALWNAHMDQKRALCDFVAATTGRTLDPNRCTLGFARRMTGYKRPALIFSDLDRLRSIAARHPFQIVMAGKAHPRDEGGKEAIVEIHRAAQALGDAVPVVFLPDYDMDLAARMVSGVDVWLNNPLPPQEASGTSGMKAALNGVPNLSVLDGWWVEGWVEGITGWAIGEGGETDHVQALYRKLEERVLPLYYGSREGWVRVMKGAITRNASFFNSHRMLRRYVTEAYMR